MRFMRFITAVFLSAVFTGQVAAEASRGMLHSWTEGAGSFYHTPGPISALTTFELERLEMMEADGSLPSSIYAERILAERVNGRPVVSNGPTLLDVQQGRAFVREGSTGYAADAVSQALGGRTVTRDLLIRVQSGASRGLRDRGFNIVNADGVAGVQTLQLLGLYQERRIDLHSLSPEAVRKNPRMLQQALNEFHNLRGDAANMVVENGRLRESTWRALSSFRRYAGLSEGTPYVLVLSHLTNTLVDSRSNPGTPL